MWTAASRRHVKQYLFWAANHQDMDKSRKASHTPSNWAGKLFYDRRVCRLWQGILAQNPATDSTVICGLARVLTGSCTEKLHIIHFACCATYIWQVLVTYHVPEVESCDGQEQHIGKQAHVFHSEKKVHKKWTRLKTTQPPNTRHKHSNFLLNRMH